VKVEVIKMEIWKPIELQGEKQIVTYAVSNLGNVKVFGHVHLDSQGRLFHVKEKLLKPYGTGSEYRNVDINNKTYPVHRLVAKAFIPNPNSKPHVNHKDSNPRNNHVSNLEWVTIKENNDHRDANNPNSLNALAKAQKDRRRPVRQFDMGGNFIAEYPSIKHAILSIGNPNLHSGGISGCCKGTRNHAGGFRWQYV
jgi:hypothetical protein